MLTKLVHPDQTGFIKGRYVGENVRLISDIMKQTRVSNTPGKLISVDFKKAFDPLEWSCIQSDLKKFNFGDSLRKWIEIFNMDVENAALNNGFRTGLSPLEELDKDVHSRHICLSLLHAKSLIGLTLSTVPTFNQIQKKCFSPPLSTQHT